MIKLKFSHNNVCTPDPFLGSQNWAPLNFSDLQTAVYHSISWISKLCNAPFLGYQKRVPDPFIRNGAGTSLRDPRNGAVHSFEIQEMDHVCNFEIQEMEWVNVFSCAANQEAPVSFRLPACLSQILSLSVHVFYTAQLLRPESSFF